MSMARGALVTWGRVLRISLWPTAVSDGLAGLALAGLNGCPTGSQWGLFGASMGIYHGAMALNDWADSQQDASTRPERPIPSGLVDRNAVLAVALTMILGGVAIAASMDLRFGIWMAGIASLAVGYDLWLRGPLLGPLTLGTCRALHMGAPIVLLSHSSLSEHLPLLVGYGVYVFTLSRLAHMEELPAEQLGKKPLFLVLAQATAFATPLLLSLLQDDLRHPWLVLTLAGLGLAVLLRSAFAEKAWPPARVQASVGTALRLLLVYAAAAALTGTGSFAPVAAACILAGYPIAYGLRKLFPPT